MKKFVNIFDLDFTLIDSSHRINAFGDVSYDFDLDFWIENCTYDMIMRDKLLPLADLCREFQKTNFVNIAMTARVMTFADFEFLRKHELNFDAILHREDSLELDHVLKEKKLKELFSVGEYIPFLAFDDKKDNLNIFAKYGFKCIDSDEFNKKIGVELAVVNDPVR